MRVKASHFRVMTTYDFRLRQSAKMQQYHKNQRQDKQVKTIRSESTQIVQ
eukprot:CAMPEP_0202002484 /NCGR_PEP_ID=MMETSP0905-20130828/8313_1 /ASSEMBLY_ACC=CAM_ASM_000554 /TAXON_ID=420261 /ORGANISM="Thalassiosira antarctica, Strain CCMP982" /LENGTH=49 /DNA_ID= /DNA_START= /DNA_END= /DNA_ORIENTATION=